MLEDIESRDSPSNSASKLTATDEFVPDTAEPQPEASINEPGSSSTSTRLTSTQVAQDLGISLSTLRRWTAAFKRHLSQTANPDKGMFRYYSTADLDVLHRANDLLLRSRISISDIDRILALPPHELETDAAIANALRELLTAQLKIQDDRIQRQAEELSKLQIAQEELRAALRKEIKLAVTDLDQARHEAQTVRNVMEVIAKHARVLDNEVHKAHTARKELKDRLDAIEGQGWLSRFLGRRPRRTE